MKILTDTPSLYAPNQNGKEGLIVVPACTVLSDTAYKDIEDITTDDFLRRIGDGESATSSQPSIGDILEAIEKAEDDILALPIGDGLSGTYQNMESAKKLSSKSNNIHIIDTRTLAGPQKYLVEKAIKLRDSGCAIEDIKTELQGSVDSSLSFVIPSDFEFLKRSGRLTPFAAKIGTVMKIIPVMTLTEDKKKITKFCIKTSKKGALDAIIAKLKDTNVGDGWLITVCHGGAEKEASETVGTLRQSFPSSRFECHLLPPSLVCHGGPGCILIQAVKL